MIFRRGLLFRALYRIREPRRRKTFQVQKDRYDDPRIIFLHFSVQNYKFDHFIEQLTEVFHFCFFHFCLLQFFHLQFFHLQFFHLRVVLE